MRCNSSIYWLVINSLITLLIYFVILWIYPIFEVDTSQVRNINSVYVKADVKPLNGGLTSSVWCRGDTRATRFCRFRNLCYNPSIDEYIFFRGSESVLYGLPHRSRNGSLPYYVADLSSVEELNTHYFTLTYVPLSSSKHLKVNILEEPTLVLKRFKPDNLMHTIHDDLLPVFATLQEICGGADKECFRKFRLAFLDQLEDHHFMQLYGFLLPSHLMLSTQLQKDSIYCFQTAYVGLNKDTTWYNYGYQQPQGPKTVPASSTIIRTFVRFVLENLGMHHELCNESRDSYVVLLSRKATRRILNEDEIVQAVIAEINSKVIVLDDIETNVTHAVRLVACADMIIGMHGAALVLAMFMRPTSALLEMFPYAIPSADYTPYKTLAHIFGQDIEYGVWENRNAKDTVMHPEWPPELGGLTHLTPEERRQIIESVEVPKHLCCTNPQWLFRIYQDTVVDVYSFRQVLRQLYDNAKTKKKIMKHNRDSTRDYYPGPVLNMSCIAVHSLTSHYYLLTWQLPWNVQFLSAETIRYQIVMQNLKESGFTSTIVNETSHIIPVTDLSDKYNIWVMCFMNDTVGNMQWATCP